MALGIDILPCLDIHGKIVHYILVGDFQLGHHITLDVEDIYLPLSIKQPDFKRTKYALDCFSC